jgi:hypothetical protein
MGGVEWIYLAEGRDEWLAVLNASSIVQVSSDSGSVTG